MSEIIEDATSGPRAQGNPSGGAGLGETPCSKPTMKEMSDTPETDEFTKSCYLQMGDLIRLVKKLEKERDEARSAADEWRIKAATLSGCDTYYLFPWEKP